MPPVVTRRAQRPALDVAQDHPQRRPGAQPRHALQQRAPVAARRGRPHRLGRLQPHGGGDGGERAQHRGDRDDGQARQRPARRTCGARSTGKRKISAYRPISPTPSHLPSASPSSAAAAHHRRDQLEVVQGDGAVRVAERLERGDLLALRRDQPRRDHVQQEARPPPGRSRAARCPAPAARGSRCPAWRARPVRRGRGRAARRSAPAAGSRRRSPPAAKRAGASLSATRLKAPCMSMRRRQFVLVDPEHAEGAQVGHAPQAARRCIRATAPCR